ncbi:MAG: RDD family protein [Pseudomonadota bacterium]
MSTNNNYWEIINLSLIILSIPLGILLVFISRKRDKFIVVSKEKISSISRRILAYVIDLVICANIGYWIYKYSFYIQNNISIFVYLISYFSIVFFYVTLTESSRLQGTLGKYSVGIKIARNDGGKISFMLSAARLILNVFFNTVFPLIPAVIFFSKHKQCAHDIITNTIVVKHNI